MKIKVPFRKGILIREKWVNFEFNIAALEGACSDLKIEFWEMSEADPYDFGLSVMYNAYVQGCKSRYKRPKYKLAHAVVWNENMSQESKKVYSECIAELMGRLRNGVKSEKKK